jgi:Flp pilus assembly protein TadG
MPGVRRHRDQRGALAIEFTLIISALMVTFLLLLQYSATAHAERVATAAAEEALAAASAYDGSVASGESAANHYLTDLGSSLTNTHVTVTRSPTSASVDISGEVERLFPLLPVRVSIHLEGPVERFVAAR